MVSSGDVLDVQAIRSPVHLSNACDLVVGLNRVRCHYWNMDLSDCFVEIVVFVQEPALLKI